MTYMSKMKRALGLLPLLAALVLFPTGCDFLDPTQVENPRTTDEDLLEAEEPTQALLPGLRAQFARLQASTIVLTENVSDNFSIHGTGLNSAYDFPGDIKPQTVDATGTTGLYWNAQELRSLADFVLDEIVPADDQATAADIAEAHYYRGMAYLHLGENMVGAPVAEDSAAVTPDSLLALAVADLDQATGTNAIGLAAHAALARAYRLLGDGTNAISAAQTVLGNDPAFLFQVDYDRNSIENWPYYFVVSRTLREMQPLPRLDFLDPKYLSFEAPIATAKAEEMHLIEAEANMAAGSWTAGREDLAEAIEAAQARGTVSYYDDDPRVDATFVIRPRDEEIAVQASPSSPARSGLIYERPGTIDAAPVSNTSLNADSIRALPVATAADQEALLHALYLARQEILFLEGRRMSDLGIRLPIMLREIEANPAINLDDFGTVITVPSYIPAAGGLDTYTPISPYPAGTAAEDVDVEPDVLTIVIDNDMNAVLAANRGALPLF